jgi:hypothetical protein
MAILVDKAKDKLKIALDDGSCAVLVILKVICSTLEWYPQETDGSLSTFHTSCIGRVVCQ